MSSLAQKIFVDISEFEKKEYLEKRLRELPKERKKRLGNDLTEKLLIARFTISAERFGVIDFLRSQFQKLIKINEFDFINVFFERTFADEKAGYYLYQLVSRHKEYIQPVYGTLEYQQFSNEQAYLTVIYYGDVNPFIGVPFSARFYKSIKSYLFNLAVFLNTMLGVESLEVNPITIFNITKVRKTEENRRMATRLIKGIYHYYEVAKSDPEKYVHPPSVDDIIRELDEILGIKYSKSAIYDIINQAVEEKGEMSSILD